MAEYAPILLGEDPPIGDAVQGLIIGTDPLDFEDGDTAYVETYQTAAFDASMVSFRLPQGVSASPSARVWVAATRRALLGTAGLAVYARPPGEAFSGSIVRFPSVLAGGGYETTTMELDFTSIPWAPDVLMSPETVFHIYNTTISGESATLRTTWLRFIVEGFIPLRQLHRDDGHGMTPPRAFGGASRIRTGRAYGYD